MNLVFRFFEHVTEDQISKSVREFADRIADKVQIRQGLAYWLYSEPGFRVGTAKLQSNEEVRIDHAMAHADQYPVCSNYLKWDEYGHPKTEI